MERKSLRSFLWSLPQPVFVFGSTVLAASALATEWMDSELLVMVLLYLPIPLFFMLERLIPRRRDWLQGPGDLLEDAFWILGGMYIWFPIFDEHYDTPISDAFVAETASSRTSSVRMDSDWCVDSAWRGTRSARDVSMAPT